jgi:hypothetical protein
MRVASRALVILYKYKKVAPACRSEFQHLQLLQIEFLKCTLELAYESNSGTLSRFGTQRIEGALTKALNNISAVPTLFDRLSPSK